MAINGMPCDHRIGFGAGLASGNPMSVPGILSTSNLLWLVSWTAAGVYLGQVKTDFTLSDDSIQAGSIDLSSKTFVCCWTNAPAA